MDLETPGQRIARARRRRGLSQAVLAGLVGRSESWLSQVERGRRDIDSHAVLTRLAEVLRIAIEQITTPGAGTDDGQHAYPAAALIEQAMMRYGTVDASAGLSRNRRASWGTCVRWPVRLTSVTRQPATKLPAISCQGSSAA
jgi:transcriptional regulator with XRE-family HTH domain